MSDISLEYITQFGSISNVTITGHDHTVQCNHQGGLVGENIINIVMQGVMWDECQGVYLQNFSNACIYDCTFQYSVVSYALNLDGCDLIFISNNTFSFNNGAVYANALSINVHNSSFYSNGFGEALHIAGYYTFYSNTTNITLTNSIFTRNLGPSLVCNGNPHLSIHKSEFTNNFHSAIVLNNCFMLLKNDILFYNNTVAISNKASFWSSGGAIYSISSTVNITGTTRFLRNKALHQGGAIYLLDSTMNVFQGLVKFHQNTADMGGAICTNLNSTILANQNTILEFTNNSALYGGALYVNISQPYPYNPPKYQNVILHFYELLMASNHFQSNTARNGGSLTYFQNNFDAHCIPDPERSFKQRNLFSSSPCKTTIFDASVKVNASDYESHTVLFWIRNLKFSAIIVDYFNNFIDASNVTLSCIDCKCNNSHSSDYIYTIDSSHNDVTLLAEDSIKKCCNLNEKEHTITASLLVDNNLHVSESIPVQWEEKKCNDVLHFRNKECDRVTCYDLQSNKSDGTLYLKIPPGFQCHQSNDLTVTPGYWYDNGLIDYVISCPPEYCDFAQWSANILSQPFPDRDLQCKKNRTGFSCGECNHTNHSIKYGSTDCILLDKCNISSTPLSLLVLFIVSLCYWCLVITFIFILLHFNFNVIAGHAFGIIFYYSVLAQVVSVLSEVTQLRYCAIAEDYYAYDCNLPQNYASKILPFLFSIGTLKPPFMQYLKLCLGRAEKIDHIALDYIHPLIVFGIVVTIFISARKFVCAARLYGRYVNSKSICLLILLSYSSVSYTSMQLL